MSELLEVSCQRQGLRLELKKIRPNIEGIDDEMRMLRTLQKMIMAMTTQKQGKSN